MQPQTPRHPNARANTDVPRPKILRIGVILGDKIVEERLIRDRGPVTVGQSGKNTFAVPTPELPRSWGLFQTQQGRYAIHFTDSMDGRISEGGQVLTLAQLKQMGRATRVGQNWVLPLNESSRGKIVIGDMTLLFQFVQAPPLQPRPQLPHSVRGSFTDRIDPYMATVLALSLAAHLVIFCYFKFFVKDLPPASPEVIPDQFARVVMERPRPPAPPKEMPGPGEGEKKEEKGEEKKEEKKGGDDKPKVADKPAGPENVQEKVAQTAVLRTLNQLAAKGKNGTTIATSDKEAWGDLDKGLKKVGQEGGVQIATTTSGGTRSTGSGEYATGKEIGVGGPTGPGSTGKEKVEEAIKTRADTGKLEGDDTAGLDPNIVAGTINRLYKARVNACYQRALKMNPNLGGRVDIAFTVGVAGNVVKAAVNGFDSSVDQCIEQEVRRWRFNKPESPAEFEIPFILRKLN